MPTSSLKIITGSFLPEQKAETNYLHWASPAEESFLNSSIAPPSAQLWYVNRVYYLKYTKWILMVTISQMLATLCNNPKMWRKVFFVAFKYVKPTLCLSLNGPSHTQTGCEAGRFQGFVVSHKFLHSLSKPRRLWLRLFQQITCRYWRELVSI